MKNFFSIHTGENFVSHLAGITFLDHFCLYDQPRKTGDSALLEAFYIGSGRMSLGYLRYRKVNLILRYHKVNLNLIVLSCPGCFDSFPFVD
ncbi:hypothetical protein KSF_105960 [Reticulibacter mediterranei]|uniref:Uncharacterized protein n=1 Tax=Reticulibacter mediterranei TaxID=2778369 RepID=A0A8J3ITZ4_9CHLR|nr:hypothetical protein KSF_105960 [Reticulibacter mediterranei]